MPRKHSLRQVTPVRLPAGLRPKLTREQLRALALIHISLVDSLVSGSASLELLWEWMAALLTWSRVAKECGVGEDQIEPAVQLAIALAARFELTGRVALGEEEQQIARDGSVVMDLLAETVDLDVAHAVSEWSRAEISRLRG